MTVYVRWTSVENREQEYGKEKERPDETRMRGFYEAGVSGYNILLFTSNHLIRYLLAGNQQRYDTQTNYTEKV